MFLLSSCGCLCPIYWSHVLSWEWRRSWSSADRPCSNYIWIIKNLIAYKGAAYIGDLTVVMEAKVVDFIPTDTLRNNDVVITWKRRHFDIITSKRRHFDVIMTLFLRHVFSGISKHTISTNDGLQEANRSTCRHRARVQINLLKYSLSHNNIWTQFCSTFYVFVMTWLRS